MWFTSSLVSREFLGVCFILRPERGAPLSVFHFPCYQLLSTGIPQLCHHQHFEGLQENPGFPFTDSLSGLSKPPWGTPLLKSQPQTFLPFGGRFPKPFLDLKPKPCVQIWNFWCLLGLNYGLFFFLRFLLILCIWALDIAVLRHTRREHQIPLQMVVSHHVVAGN